MNKTPKIKDDKFINAYNDFITKKFKIYKEEEKNLITIFNQKYEDLDSYDSENEIGFINVNLLKANKIQSFFDLAKKYNYELISKILNWAEKLLKVIQYN